MAGNDDNVCVVLSRDLTVCRRTGGNGSNPGCVRTFRVGGERGLVGVVPCTVGASDVVDRRDFSDRSRTQSATVRALNDPNMWVTTFHEAGVGSTKAAVCTGETQPIVRGPNRIVPQAGGRCVVGHVRRRPADQSFVADFHNHGRHVSPRIIDEV